MLKTLFCISMLLGCGSCQASDECDPHYSLVVLLDPEESVMVKSADGKCSIYIDYIEGKINKEITYKGLNHDKCYHIEYHFIIWVQCTGCNSYYNAADGGCKNQNCPSKTL